MRRGRYVVLAPLMVLCLLRVDQVPAQSVEPPPPVPIDRQAEPVPEWRLWWLFHNSMVHFAAHPGSDIYAMLEESAGLGEIDVVELLVAAEIYVDRMQQLDERMRDDIARRREQIGDPRSIYEAYRHSTAATELGDGRVMIDVSQVLRDALEQEGYIERDSVAREDAYQGMRQRLESRLGEAALTELDQLVAEQVSPNVVQVERPPLRRPSREEILSSTEWRTERGD